MTAPALHTDKLPRTKLPPTSRKHSDKVVCPGWGIYNIEQHPDILERWLAYQKAGLAYPGIDALFRALADMLRIEQSRDIIPTGELTLTVAPVFDETDEWVRQVNNQARRLDQIADTNAARVYSHAVSMGASNEVALAAIFELMKPTMDKYVELASHDALKSVDEIVENTAIPAPMALKPPPKPEIAPTPVPVAKRAIPERTGFTFSGLLQIAGEKPFFYILAPAEWLTDFHITPDSGNALYFTIKMYARDVTRVEPDKIKVELFHTGEQAERRLEIIAACRKWEARQEKVEA